MEGIVATRNYQPGDDIYKESAFAKVVQRKFKDVMCEFCCKSSFSLKACKDCVAVKYCGKDCQKKDWGSHKLECKYLKNLPKGPSVDFVRLLGKVILKLKDKDWKNIKSTVLGKEFTFDDIESHYKELSENPRLFLFFNEMKELITNYIGFENMPDDDTLIKIVGKVRISLTPVIGFFIGVSQFNFECIPNSNATLNGNTIKVWAIKKIRKDKDKVTILGRMILPLKKFMNSNFNCKCTDCSLPYGESILTNIIEKKRAYTLICETERYLNAITAFPEILLLPEFRQVADRLLRETENVLGETNYLRMRLIALKCLSIGGDPLQIKELLLKLERSMRSVFGEFYIEMLPIYKELCSAHLGFPPASLEYGIKAVLIESKIRT